MNVTLPDRIESYVSTWHKFASRWQHLHMLLGLSATSASLVVATFSGELGVFWTRIIAFVAALSVGLITTFDLTNRGKNYRTAWRHLNECHMRYLAKECSEKELVKAYGEAEAMIGHFDMNVSGNGGSNGSSDHGP